MKKILFALLFSVFLFSATAFPALSQADMTIGVSVDDYFTFEQESISYTTTDPSTPLSSFATPWLYLNESDYATYTVVAVDAEAKNITFDVLTHWSNGTETTAPSAEPIESSLSFMAIGVDMEPGDVIRPAGFNPERSINETVLFTWGDVEREVNVHYAVWDFSWFGAGVSARDYYWDKATGMKIKEVTTYDETTDAGEIHLEQTVVCIDTNLWVIPEFPTGTVMLFVFVAATVCIDLYRRKKLRF